MKERSAHARLVAMRTTTTATALLLAMASPAAAEGLRVQYPSDGHVTTADRIFLVGTAAPRGEVTLNGKPVHRSPQGHFAPTQPLALGANLLTLRHAGQTLQLTVTRKPAEAALPAGAAFVAGSLQPAADQAVQPGAPVVFQALAAPGASVAVRVGGRTIPMPAQPAAAALPDNKAGLTGLNQPVTSRTVRYAVSVAFQAPGKLGEPIFLIAKDGKQHQQAAGGSLEVLRPETPAVVEVIAEAGVARSGPSTDYSRLTPLPRGTRAAVAARDGTWLKLAHGVWLDQAEAKLLPGATPPRTIVRSLRATAVDGRTDVVIPLQAPVPITVSEEDGTFVLKLHGAVAQTDIIRLDDDPLINKLTWTQSGPDEITYRFALKTRQTWGWTTRYDGTSLVLGLRHPPAATGENGRLDGLRVVLDAGHGGDSDGGTHGPTGAAEKDLTLAMAKVVKAELEARGAWVHMNRETDAFVGLKERGDQIAQVAPHCSISLHYNALPDAGDAQNIRGVGGFWFHPQAHSLAKALHDALTTPLARPSYGLWWDNLALARPSATPSVLMELGFLTNPEEFEWCADPGNRPRVARAIADGLAAWLRTSRTTP